MVNHLKKDVYYLFFGILFIAFFIGCSPVPPPTPTPENPTLPVNNSTQGTSFSTIQAAIDASVPGDIIIVYPGTYYENIDFKGKNITIQSTDPLNSTILLNTIIDGQLKGSVVTFKSGETKNAVLKGFTIQNGSGSKVGNWSKYGGGIYCVQSSPTISNNFILNNNADNGGGIYCSFSSPIIRQNKIGLNSAKGGGGIFCGDSSSPAISQNTISENSATHNSHGGGILCYNSSPNIVSNEISWNDATNGGGIYILDSMPVIYGNDIHKNTATQYGGGIFVSKQSIVKDSHGDSWLRLNDPPHNETNNLYSGNTHQGTLNTDGANVYFEIDFFTIGPPLPRKNSWCQVLILEF